MLKLEASSFPVKTFGLLSKPIDDVLRLKIPAHEYTISKQLVHSDAARLLDLMGLRSIFLCNNYGCLKLYSPLNDQIQPSWRIFREYLEIFQIFSVLRWAAPCSKSSFLNCIDSAMHRIERTVLALNSHCNAGKILTHPMKKERSLENLVGLTQTESLQEISDLYVVKSISRMKPLCAEQLARKE